MNIDTIRDIVIKDDGEFRAIDEIISELKNNGVSDREIREIVDEVKYEARELQKEKRWLVDLPENGYFKVYAMKKIRPNVYEFRGDHIIIVEDKRKVKKLQEKGYGPILTATCYRLEKITTMIVVINDDSERYHPLLTEWLTYEID